MELKTLEGREPAVYILGMGLRHTVKPGERETFLIVFIVLAGLAAYLRSAAAARPSPSAPIPLVASDGGMEKLWFEASLGKGDMRPLPDPEIAEEEAEAAPTPAPPPAPEAPAAEPAESFPEPLPVAEAQEAPERQRIAPMGESLLHGSRSASATSAFLAFPARTKEAAAPAPAPKPAAAAAPAPAPKRRQWRALTGN